jgi:hypothetical protein
LGCKQEAKITQGRRAATRILWNTPERSNRVKAETDRSRSDLFGVQIKFIQPKSLFQRYSVTRDSQTVSKSEKFLVFATIYGVLIAGSETKPKTRPFLLPDGFVFVTLIRFQKWLPALLPRAPLIPRRNRLCVWLSFLNLLCGS